MKPSEQVRKRQAISAVLEGRALPSQAAKAYGFSAKKLLLWLKEVRVPQHLHTKQLLRTAQRLESKLDRLYGEIQEVKQRQSG